MEISPMKSNGLPQHRVLVLDFWTPVDRRTRPLETKTRIEWWRLKDKPTAREELTRSLPNDRAPQPSRRSSSRKASRGSNSTRRKNQAWKEKDREGDPVVETENPRSDCGEQQGLQTMAEYPQGRRTILLPGGQTDRQGSSAKIEAGGRCGVVSECRHSRRRSTNALPDCKGQSFNLQGHGPLRPSEVLYASFPIPWAQQGSLYTLVLLFLLLYLAPGEPDTTGHVASGEEAGQGTSSQRRHLLNSDRMMTKGEP